MECGKAYFYQLLDGLQHTPESAIELLAIVRGSRLRHGRERPEENKIPSEVGDKPPVGPRRKVTARRPQGPMRLMDVWSRLAVDP